MGQDSQENGENVLIVGPLTPFKPDGALNARAMEEEIEYITKNGATEIVATGYLIQDFQLLSIDERTSLMETTLQSTPSEVRKIVGVTGRTIRETEELINRIKRADIWKVLSGPPYGRKSSPNEILTFFRFLDKSSSVPIIVYNHPGLGADLSLETMGHLLQLAKVSAIKETSYDLTKIFLLNELARRAHKQIYMTSEVMLISVRLGMTRISVPPPLVKLASQLLEAYRRENSEEATGLQKTILEYHHLPIRKASASIARAALSLLGIEMGRSPGPYEDLAHEEMKVLELYLKEAQIM